MLKTKWNYPTVTFLWSPVCWLWGCGQKIEVRFALNVGAVLTSCCVSGLPEEVICTSCLSSSKRCQQHAAAAAVANSHSTTPSSPLPVLLPSFTLEDATHNHQSYYQEGEDPDILWLIMLSVCFTRSRVRVRSRGSHPWVKSWGGNVCGWYGHNQGPYSQACGKMAKPPHVPTLGWYSGGNGEAFPSGLSVNAHQNHTPYLWPEDYSLTEATPRLAMPISLIHYIPYTLPSCLYPLLLV